LTEQSEANPKEPIFNIPAVVVATVAVLILVHAAQAFLLTDQQDIEFVLSFGFIPARYSGEAGSLPGGFAADLWTFFTYAFIHADLTHLGFNLAWLIPFGSALARRFGAWRYLLFMLTTAAIGAMAHLVTHLGAIEPMIGASAAISGAMAAAMRFVFQRQGRIGSLTGTTASRDVSGSAVLAVSRNLARVKRAVWLRHYCIWRGRSGNRLASACRRFLRRPVSLQSFRSGPIATRIDRRTKPLIPDAEAICYR